MSRLCQVTTLKLQKPCLSPALHILTFEYEGEQRY